MALTNSVRSSAITPIVPSINALVWLYTAPIAGHVTVRSVVEVIGGDAVGTLGGVERGTAVYGGGVAGGAGVPGVESGTTVYGGGVAGGGGVPGIAGADVALGLHSAGGAGVAVGPEHATERTITIKIRRDLRFT